MNEKTVSTAYHRIEEVAIVKAVAHLEQGGLLAYPTEGLYGLGCDPENENSIEKLLTFKGRSKDKGLILVGSAPWHFAPFFESSELMEMDWESLRSMDPKEPVTWVLPCRNRKHPLLSVGEPPQLAIRLTAYPVIAQLCQAYGKALVSTSANRSGGSPAQKLTELIDLLEGNQDFKILKGSLGEALGPSEIRIWPSRRLIRVKAGE